MIYVIIGQVYKFQQILYKIPSMSIENKNWRNGTQKNSKKRLRISHSIQQKGKVLQICKETKRLVLDRGRKQSIGQIINLNDEKSQKRKQYRKIKEEYQKGNALKINSSNDSKKCRRSILSISNSMNKDEQQKTNMKAQRQSAKDRNIINIRHLKTTQKKQSLKKITIQNYSQISCHSTKDEVVEKIREENKELLIKIQKLQHEKNGLVLKVEKMQRMINEEKEEQRKEMKKRIQKYNIVDQQLKNEIMKTKYLKQKNREQLYMIAAQQNEIEMLKQKLNNELLWN